MPSPINELSIEGFKSIHKLEEFKLNNLNVLIGANGAGKSNFIELFRMIREMTLENLQNYIAKSGGADGFFFEGPKATPQIKIRFRLAGLAKYAYSFILEPAADARLLLSGETITCSNRATGLEESYTAPSWIESYSKRIRDNFGITDPEGWQFQIYDSVSKWTVYHFHDTSPLAPMRREQSIEDTAYLRPDASNIAPFLRHLREANPAQYTLIRDTIRIVAPFFDDFLLKERTAGPEKKVTLDWHQKGSDFPFQPWQLSDGTLRFVCLATALLQPDPPSTIVIDEPELGLHPHALEVLAGLLKKVATQTQIILSTQSAPLVSQFDPEDIITVTRKNGASIFARLEKDSLSEWLQDYTLGELWQKNVIEAGASSD